MQWGQVKPNLICLIGKKFEKKAIDPFHKHGVLMLNSLAYSRWIEHSNNAQDGDAKEEALEPVMIDSDKFRPFRNKDQSIVIQNGTLILLSHIIS